MYKDFLFFLLFILFVTRLIYKIKLKPMKNFKHFQERALRYEAAKDYEKALEIRKQGLQLENLSNLERGDLFLSIGGAYLYLNNVEEATYYFDKAFKIAKHEKYPYDKQYEKIINTYVKAGKFNEAKNILDELIERQSYDKRFKKLEKLRGKI
jgi:pentatricopeptide repeat protein